MFTVKYNDVVMGEFPNYLAAYDFVQHYLKEHDMQPVEYHDFVFYDRHGEIFKSRLWGKE